MISPGPLTLSPRVWLYPAGSRPPALPTGFVMLPQIASEAFGDGSHPTTRLCAGAVDLLCRQNCPSSFLDVGTGTGVLARIARARGVRFIVGTDIDPIALETAQTHGALDVHSTEILITDQAPDSWGARFNLVVANILEGPLRSLAESLSRALAPEGVLLISGFTRIQIPGLRLAFEQAGLTYTHESSLEEWALLMFKKGADTS